MWNLCCPLQAVTVITQIQKHTFSQQLEFLIVWYEWNKCLFVNLKKKNILYYRYMIPEWSVM